MNNNEIEKIRNLNIRKTNIDILLSITSGVAVTTLTATAIGFGIASKQFSWYLPMIGFATIFDDVQFLKIIKNSLKQKENLKNATQEDIGTGKVKHKNLFLK